MIVQGRELTSADVNRYNADVNSLATEIAFAEQENYRASSPLCQAARNGYTEATLYSYHISMRGIVEFYFERDRISLKCKSPLIKPNETSAIHLHLKVVLTKYFFCN